MNENECVVLVFGLFCLLVAYIMKITFGRK